MKNIHLLPTKKPSRLFKFANELHLDNTPKDYYKKYNIYITSDEDIKEGDWYFITESISKCESKYEANDLTDICKKIILTTDQDLIKDGVQAIDDEFLEWFVKNPSCEEVEVDLWTIEKRKGEYFNPPLKEYEIIIPQEELKNKLKPLNQNRMSVTNFEEFTHELTSEEMEILPVVVHGFRNYKKENPIKSELIVTRMNEYLNTKGYKTKMNGPRLRKMVNYIRTNGIIPLIATSNGYFTSDCKQTIQEQIQSLQERANSIERCAQGLRKFL